MWDKVIEILINHLNRIMGRGYKQNMKIYSTLLINRIQVKMRPHFFFSCRIPMMTKNDVDMTGEDLKKWSHSP